jgi:hypothetical protein
MTYPFSTVSEDEMFAKIKKLKVTRRLVIPALLVVALLAGFGIASVVTAASGGWTIDGQVPDADTTKFSDPFGAMDELGPINSNTTKLGVINTALPPMLGFTNPNAQVDLRNVWLGTKVDGSGDSWLYLAWERDSTNGSGVIMFEFQQSPLSLECDYDAVDQVLPIDPAEQALIDNCNPWANRQPGDFLIVWDQSGKKINIILRTFDFNDNNPANGIWDGPIAEPLYLDAGTTLDTTVSAAAIGDDTHFGEAAVNLSQTIYAGNPTACQSIGNIIPGTLTGNSDTADYKDTILSAGFAGVISVGNCGQLTVIKHMKNDNGGTAVAGDFTMTVAGNLPGGGSSTSFAGKESPGTTESLLPGSFSVTESPNPKSGYYAGSTSGDCSGTIAAGDKKTCTITNDDIPPKLRLRKTVTTDNGGTALPTAWTLTATGALASPTNLSGTTPVDSGTSFKADTYTLGESGGPSGYTAGAWSCVLTGTATPVTVTDSKVVVGLGQDITCTINNDDTKATPSGATAMSWVLHDKLTITGIRPGSPSPAATVTFELYKDDDTCGSSSKVGSEASVEIISGVAQTSTGIAVSQTGTYYWKAIYTGDQYNNGFTTPCGYEVTTIGATYGTP